LYKTGVLRYRCPETSGLLDSFDRYRLSRSTVYYQPGYLVVSVTVDDSAVFFYVPSHSHSPFAHSHALHALLYATCAPLSTRDQYHSKTQTRSETILGDLRAVTHESPRLSTGARCGSDQSQYVVVWCRGTVYEQAPGRPVDNRDGMELAAYDGRWAESSRDAPFSTGS